MDNKFMILTISFKAILIVSVIVVLLGAVLPHSQRAFAQVDCNATPDDPSCQSPSSPPPSDNNNNNPPADNSQPSQPSTQTCPDGSVIDASATCPSPPPPSQPSTQTCPDGSVIDASATCPTPTSTAGSNNPPTVSCNPNDPNPPASCNKPVQPDSTGAYPSGTVVSGTGIHCPAGTISKHAFCQTQAQQDKNIAISKQRGCSIIGGVTSLLPPPLGKAVNGFNNRLNGCQ